MIKESVRRREKRDGERRVFCWVLLSTLIPLLPFCRIQYDVPEYYPPSSHHLIEIISFSKFFFFIDIFISCHFYFKYSTSAGNVKVFFDPRLSKKGALLTAGKAPKKREKEAEDQTIVGEIFYPNALPLFRTEMTDKKIAREKKDPLRTKMPDKQLDKGPGNKPNMSFFFTKYVTEGLKINNSRAEDPREALLKMDEKAKADPIFFGRAYDSSNPKNVLHTQTFEEEQEEFKKKQKRF